MNIKVVAGEIAFQEVDVIIVSKFEDKSITSSPTATVDALFDSGITKLIEEKEITGRRGEITLIHTFGKITPSRIVVLGLGGDLISTKKS